MGNSVRFYAFWDLCLSVMRAEMQLSNAAANKYGKLNSNLICNTLYSQVEMCNKISSYLSPEFKE